MNHTRPQGIRLKARSHGVCRPLLCHHHAPSSHAYDLQTFIRQPSGFKHLDLSCSRELQEEGQLEALSEAFMQHAAAGGLELTTLILKENNFGGAMSTLAPSLRAVSSSLTSLDMSHCNLRGYRNARNIVALSGPLGSLTNLAHINLAHNDLGLKGAVVVAKAFKKMSRLSTINLAHNDLGDEGCIEIISSLHGKDRLTELDMTGNDFGVEGCGAIAELIEAGHPLRRLVLNGNDLGSGISSRISKAIMSNISLLESLEELHLSGCNLRDDGLKALAPSFASLRNLKHLDLNHNSIGSSGIASLSSAIRSGSLSTLTHLSIGYNTRIGEVQDEAGLVSLISHLTSVKSLDLRSTNLHQPTALDSLSRIASKLKLHTLLLGGNREILMDENVLRLAQVLSSSRESLTSLDLSSTGLELDNDLHITEAISSMPRLRSLDLSGNPKLMQQSSSAIPPIPTSPLPNLPSSLTSLNISDCDLHPSSIPYIAQQLEEMTGLTRLAIAGNKELESSILQLSPWVLRTAAVEVRGALRRKPRKISSGSSEKPAAGYMGASQVPSDLIEDPSELSGNDGDDFIALLSSAQENFILSHRGFYSYIWASKRGPMPQ